MSRTTRGAAVVTGGESAPGDRGRRVPGHLTVRVVFFAGLLLLVLGYTEMAFELEWRTTAGRIGPGFFPRIIGILGALICLGALVNSLRGHGGGEVDDGEAESGEADLGRHPLLLLAVTGGGAAMVMVFLVLGAVVTGAVFMFFVLALLNPRAWVLNAVLSIAVPLGLYLLFQTALNSGLPPGLLPGF